MRISDWSSYVCSSDLDADGCVCHCGGVINAVAHHRDRHLVTQLLDGLDLILRHEITHRLVDPYLRGDGGCDLLIVTRYPDHAGDAQRLELLYGRLGSGAGRGHKPGRTKVPPPLTHHN